jgi:thiamine biosynthesis protein ThiI
MDKLDIISLAHEIDTYELSIEPYKDPCSLHARNPATWAKIDAVLALEQNVDIEGIVADTLSNYVEELTI